MSLPIQLTQIEARKLVLHRQGLLGQDVFGNGESATRDAIQRIGYVQIDTLAVVVRAHHHTLWSRQSDYKEKFLWNLLAKRDVFEYWSHAAAYLPQDDYQYVQPMMERYRNGKQHWSMDPDPKIKTMVLDRIRKEGPLMSRDFEMPDNWPKESWVGWKPAKRALEQLFMEGRLLVSGRNHFHKVYDLAERVLPNGITEPIPSREAFWRHICLKTMDAQGIASVEEIRYLRKGWQKILNEVIQHMLETAEIIPVHVEGSARTYYGRPALIGEADGLDTPKLVHILSPFDNLLIQRKRLLALFGFDYQMEAYYPVNKRVFGHFCLPILYGDTFIGRIDAKIDRKQKHFVVRKLFVEFPAADMDAFLTSFAAKLVAFARFNGADSISIEATQLKKWLAPLRRMVKGNF